MADVVPQRAEIQSQAGDHSTGQAEVQLMLELLNGLIPA
jgi:hypothetical protein